jgi:hypothetical protein
MPQLIWKTFAFIHIQPYSAAKIQIKSDISK